MLDILQRGLLLEEIEAAELEPLAALATDDGGFVAGAVVGCLVVGASVGGFVAGAAVGGAVGGNVVADDWEERC